MAAALVTLSAASLNLTPTFPRSSSRNGPHLLSLPSKGFPLKPSKFPSIPSSKVCFSATLIPSATQQPLSTPIFPFSSKAPSPLELQLPTLQLVPLIRRLVLCFLIWVAVSFVCFFTCGRSLAAVAGDSIRASGVGLKVATALRSLGWADEAVVFALAMLPVLELRGAIPVGYWMELNPLRLTILAVLGNMVPVPIIILYLKKFASFVSQKNASATHFLDLFFKRAREKAGPVEEFQWLGLMLFVAVPFPGTGAWTGSFIAAILDMPFWPAVFANLFGVVLAGLLVNLLVNLGIKHAVVIGLLLFFLSTVMWSVLRQIKKSLNSK